MKPDTALVLVALIGIVVPVLSLAVKFLQDRRIAQEARDARAVIAAASGAAVTAAAVAAQRAVATATAVETVRVDLVSQNADLAKRLDTIHVLVNSRLSTALERLDLLLAIVLEHAPTDPRVLAILKEHWKTP